jgi:hypothetical protein
MKASIILVLLGFTVFGSMSRSQERSAEWKHGITLFQSTKTDVEKLFGKPIGENYGVTYKLRDGILYLDYYGFDHCKARYGFDADWNLPEWTVTEIEFLPDYELTLTSLRLDLRRFRKAHLNPHAPDLVSYIDDQEGIEYTVEPDGTLNSVRYFPGSRYDKFRCPKK